MPSKTFFNLSLEKQANILSAAKKEFARVPFEQTSFIDIAKDAGISRSNLYNYFTNKQELLSYFSCLMISFPICWSMDFLRKISAFSVLY